jgi:acetyl esterase/lipase
VRRLAGALRLFAGSLFLALFTRVRPHRWLPPAISLRILRAYFEPGSTAIAANMRRAVPAGGRTVRTDLSYDRAAGRDGLFDLIRPDGPGPFPVVVFLHGGGNYYGSKADVLPYCELLATHGFAGVALNYPRIPEHRHPAAPLAVLRAIEHLRAHASEYDVDPGRIVIAGDSAGAQIAASAALACTNPSYAEALGATSTPPAASIRGVVLFCGTVDAASLLNAGRVFTSILASSQWALAGRRDWLESESAALYSVRDHLTPSYPPTFLRAGNADPLTAGGTVPMATRLRELGVEVDCKIPGDAANPVHHQYQFKLGTPEADETVTDLVRFLNSH